jgi:hypothetical protein
MASTVKYLSVDLSALANTLLNSAGSLNRTCGGNLAAFCVKLKERVYDDLFFYVH